MSEYEWESRSIKELVESVSSGGTPTAGDSRYYTEFGTPFLKIDDITKANGRFVDKADQSITDLGLAESAAKVFPAGTIVVTMYGTMGVTKTLRSPMATNQAIAALVPPFRCDPNYLAHALSFRRASLERLAAQTTQPNWPSYASCGQVLPLTCYRAAFAQCQHDFGAGVGDGGGTVVGASFFAWLGDFGLVRASAN